MHLWKGEQNQQLSVSSEEIEVQRALVVSLDLYSTHPSVLVDVEDSGDSARVPVAVELRLELNLWRHN